MGTRHLVAVQVDGEYKVAQYGQWDGYPSGQGAGLLAWLHDADLAYLKQQVANTSQITQEAYQAAWVECGANPDSDYVSMDVNEKFKEKYPHLSRDASWHALEEIYAQSPGLTMLNQIGFANDSLFCEWAYVIDFDKNTFEVFKGFNHTPLDTTDRFYNGAAAGTEYYPVSKVAEFNLDNLPTVEEFVLQCEPDQGD